MRRDYLILGGAVVASLIAGGAGGYIFAQKQLEKKYSEISEAEIEQAKEYYKRHYKQGEFATPQGVIDSTGTDDNPISGVKEQLEGIKEQIAKEKRDLEELVSPYSGKKKTEEPQEVVQNVFINSEPITEEDLERDFFENRDTSRPYILTKDEFFHNDEENEQTTLTYFEADDVLTDSHDDPIPDIDATIGEDNLLKFGVGSDDRNLLYIRNEKSGMDFEVHRSTGAYTHEVLGFDFDENADQRHKVRKFRGDDE